MRFAGLIKLRQQNVVINHIGSSNSENKSKKGRLIATTCK